MGAQDGLGDSQVGLYSGKHRASDGPGTGKGGRIGCIPTGIGIGIGAVPTGGGNGGAKKEG